MCGIFGAAGIFDYSYISATAKKLYHRGPDDSGIYSDLSNHVTLGHARLSITDLLNGHQPMTDPSQRYVIVFNGEIYNHRELRSELTKIGFVFNTSHSDTEVLLSSYIAWGKDMLYKLNGMFAFCIYDKLKKSFFFARDRFGEKPLYYRFFQSSGIIFSSEINPLVEYGQSIEYNDLALRKFFAYGFIPSPLTPYKNIWKLSPGECMEVDLNDFSYSKNKWYTYIVDPMDKKQLSLEDAEAEFETILKKSVQLRMISDRRVGIALSGGLDSSSVLTCIDPTSDTVDTYSVGFSESSYDESSVAQYISQYLGFSNKKLVLDNVMCQRIADICFKNIDDPICDSSIIPMYALAELLSKEVQVVLSGDGADELFFGYGTFKALRLAKISNYLPLASIARHLSVLLPDGKSYMNFGFKLKRFTRAQGLPECLWNPSWIGPISPHSINKYFTNTFDIEEIYSEAMNFWSKSLTGNLYDQSSEFYANLYLPDCVLNKVDRMTMQHGIESRAPFLDVDMVNFARILPRSYKYNLGETKWIVRRYLSKRLPQDVVKLKKRGFAAPISHFDNEILDANTAQVLNFVNHGELDALHQGSDRVTKWALTTLNRRIVRDNGYRNIRN